MRTASIALALVLAVSGAASAQDNAARAMQLFEESRGHYDAGRFDVAAELLREAYSLSPDPTLLYNMGRAYEGADRVREALDAYERYLRDAGDVRDRGAIERRVQTLRARLEREEGGEPEPGPSEPEPAPAPSGGGGVDPAGWVVMGIGVLGVGAGIVLGVLSNDAHDTAADPMTSHEDAVAQQQTAYDLASGANAAFIAGGALALAGLIWGIVSIATSGGSSERASRPLTITF
jgi:tetratricopeptide (TPR) repeat protein